MLTLEFVFTLIFMISCGTILYLGVRGISRIGDEEIAFRKLSVWEKLAESRITERADAVLNRFLHVSLRRMKIATLKVDNRLTSWLKKTKLRHEDGPAPKIDFKEISERSDRDR